MVCTMGSIMARFRSLRNPARVEARAPLWARPPVRWVLRALMAATPALTPSLRAQGTVPTVALVPGMVITHSVRVSPRTWRVSATGAHADGAIVIRGNDITVDFGGATLEGTPATLDPDLATGVAIRVDGGRNIRIVNARIRGYTVGILARGTVGLTIEHIDASNNWKPRLFSIIEHESLVDWLSFHHNENREWMRFGAAFYLEDVRGGAVRANRAEQGMNALLMVKTAGVSVTENDFSFNSGIGIGLYRSSGNTIARNRVDFNVRGYSHGFYRRGQDSAGILLYEQSDSNVVAFNTATHGGDGFFLWAGQSTMDTGAGGSNDNWLIGNDFSWAPANGIEATFSRNAMVGNRLEGNDYGVWGGYSYASLIAGNCFVRNRMGVAIEHGQDNRVAGNTFVGDTTAVYVWATGPAPAEWGYSKARDTKSRGYAVAGNTFTGNRVALRASNTAGIIFDGNEVRDVDSLTVLRDTSGVVIDGNRILFSPSAMAGECEAALSLDSVPAAIRDRAGAGSRPVQPLARRDRSAIVVDEWGPYDWRTPKLWPVDSSRTSPLRLRILGPSGRWRIVRRRGIEAVSRESGVVGDTITVRAATVATVATGATGATEVAGAADDWSLQLEYVGDSVRTPRGEVVAAGTPYRFGYEHFVPNAQWNVLFYSWADSTTAAPAAATAALQHDPLFVRRESRLDYFWYRPPLHELPQSRWALSATGQVNLPAGRYTLRTISDDGVRVWVDGRLVIDRWTHHESRVDHAPLTAGRHNLRVEYFQDDGWAELRLDIVRGTERSTGSPGPH